MKIELRWRKRYLVSFSGTPQATLEGDTLLVSSSSVAHPVAVRYTWAMNPSCNLYNRAGLPAAPFRTDDWEDMLYVR
jgi:sialate O-acetylesterase